MSKIILTDEGPTPATPSPGTTVVYTQLGVLYTLNSSGTPAAPIFSTIFDAAGDMVYASAADTPARLAIGTTGQYLSVSGGIPAWTTLFSATPPAALGPAPAAGTSTEAARRDHVHAFPVSATGDLLYANAATTVTRLGIGTAGQVLAVNSGATAPVWQNPPTFVAGPAGSTAQYTGVGVVGIAAAISAATATGGVVEILPGLYAGNLTLPPSVSLTGLGGRDDVQITGNITCTSVSGGNSISNLRLAGIFTCNAGAASTASVAFDNCVIESSTTSPLAIVDDGWDLSLTNCTVTVTVAAIDVVTGPADPSVASVTAENCNFTSTAGGVGVRTFNGSFSSVNLTGCYFSHPLNMTTVAGSSVSLRDCTLNFAPNTPTTAFSFAAGPSSLIIFGSFSLTSLVAAGTLYTGVGATARAFAGVFLGTYQSGSLPTLSGDNGALAYSSDNNALYVRRSGSWEKVATPSNNNTWTATQTFNETVFNRAAIETAVNTGTATYTMASNTVAPLIRMDTASGGGAKTVTLFTPDAGGADNGKQWVIFDALRNAGSGPEPIDIAVPGGVTINGGVGPYASAISTDGGAIVVRVVGASAWETIGY